MQLKTNKYDDTIIEWLPYNQFNGIKKIGNNNFMTAYFAI
jgi:hypothetical protein